MKGRAGCQGALRIGAALIVFWPLVGSAQPANSWLERLDTNGDGAVDLGEVRHARGVVFDRLDTDHDGFLSRDELAAARKPRRNATAQPGSRLLVRADADKDGRISRDEFLALAGQTMKRRDRNGDGRITADELPPPRPRQPSRP
ncbi:EF-hand domain-containing protein [Benzoatithermus flavus]|uniref:EF-hand domain-containing protein n=1 Tax=Benzoatithermus flavus TaxID=3108223 RepID=A0ABU8XNI8_9PROT